jgi:hypothetical protein
LEPFQEGRLPRTNITLYRDKKHVVPRHFMWAFPPIFLITAAVQKMKGRKATDVGTVPQWFQHLVCI